MANLKSTAKEKSKEKDKDKRKGKSENQEASNMVEDEPEARNSEEPDQGGKPAKQTKSPNQKTKRSGESKKGAVKKKVNKFIGPTKVGNFKRILCEKTEKNKETEKEVKKSSENNEPVNLRAAAKEEKKTDGQSPQIAALMSLYNYLLDMKEASLNSYFDKNLANYSSPTHTSSAEWEKNMSKNRSKDHKMLDHSRVKLQEEDIYINASHVTFDELEMDFIMTQYPLPNTMLDFWKMVRWLEVDRIVSIFEPNSDEAIEEFHNVPDTLKLLLQSPDPESPGIQNKSMTAMVGKSVRCEPSGYKSYFPLGTNNYFNMNEWLINTKKEELFGGESKLLTSYTVEVVQAGCSDSLITRVFNCATWPPKQLPDGETKVGALIRALWKELPPTLENSKQCRPKPIVVMCDLGLDRSATFVFTHVLVELVLAGKKVDCDALFRKFRDQRAGVFTASMFYSFAIRSALFVLKVRLRKEISHEMLAVIELAKSKVPFHPKKKTYE